MIMLSTSFLPVGYIGTCGTWQLAGSLGLCACLGEVLNTGTWLVV